MKAAAAIFALALGLRLLFLSSSVDRRWPHAATYEGDAIVWAAGAQTIASSAAPPDDPLFFRANAPAHLLAWLGFTDPARGYFGAKALWCVLSALACAATYLFGARAFTARVGLIAAGLQAFSWDAYVLATSLNTEAPYALLVVLAVAGTWWLRRRARVGLAIALGIIHGLAILVRIEHLLLLALLVVWGFGGARAADASARAQAGQGVRPLPGWRLRALLQVAVVLPALLVCVPASVEQTRAVLVYNDHQRRPTPYDHVPVTWAADARAFLDEVPGFARLRLFGHVSRSAEQHGITDVTGAVARQLWREEFGDLPERLRAPVFVSGQGPLNFALANHPDAHGGFSKAALVNRYVSEDPKLTLPLPPHLRLYVHGYAAGLGFIRADPLGWLRAVGHKLWYFAQGASLALGAYNLPLGRFGERRACDLMTPFPGHGVVWILGCAALIVAGAWLARRREGGRLCALVLLYKLLVTIAFYGYARQAASIGPVLVLLAAVALDAAVTSIAERTNGAAWHRWVRAGAGIVVVALIAGDVHAALHPPAYDIHGPLRATPDWGESAFSSNATIELRRQ